MSEIQRFDIRGEQWGIMRRTDGLGAFCWAEDLLWYQRQYRMALVINIVVVLACAVLAGYLVYHKHDPQPVAKVAAEETAKKTELLNDLEATHERTLANVETAHKVYHGSAKDLEKIKGLLGLNANLKAQIIEQNKQLTPQQQTENLKVAAKMSHKEIDGLARGVGFLKGVRVVE